jgi:hypothetical protein
MNEKTIAKIAVYGFVGLVVAPAVLTAGYNLVVVPIANGISHLVYKAKIKKGLKNGSIVEIDGQYYEVIVE